MCLITSVNNTKLTYTRKFMAFCIYAYMFKYTFHLHVIPKYKLFNLFGYTCLYVSETELANFATLFIFSHHFFGRVWKQNTAYRLQYNGVKTAENCSNFSVWYSPNTIHYSGIAIRPLLIYFNHFDHTKNEGT